jgi:hypothetical protein
MNEISTRIWQEHGTSVVWDADLAHTAAQPPTGCTVPLRQALGWAEIMPVEPPNGARAVVVTGLQAALDVLTEAEAVPVLQRLQRLVREHSKHWPEAAMVFLVQDAGRFRLHPATGSVFMKPRTPGQPEIDLGRWLWGGDVSDVSSVIAAKTDSRGKSAVTTIGYWMRRVS